MVQCLNIIKMVVKMLCKQCENFILNGGTTSFEVVYNLNNPSKLGNCKLTGELKNELNSCNNGKMKKK